MSTLGDKWCETSDMPILSPEANQTRAAARARCAKEFDNWLAERCRLIEELTVFTHREQRDAVLRILREGGK